MNTITIYTQRIDHKSIAAEILKKIKLGEDVMVDDLSVLDELIFTGELPDDVRFHSIQRRKTIGLKTARDGRSFGYDVL